MKNIVLSVLMCCSFFAQAQKTRQPVDYRMSIHFNPFALIQLDFTFLPGIEYRLTPKTTLVTEVGYIFASEYLREPTRERPASGFIFRPSVRFYLNERNNFYVQPQLFYKSVTHKVYDWLGKDCVDDVPAYEELKQFRYRRHIGGFNATAGVLVPLSRSNKSFLDFYFGVGVRYRTANVVGEPNCCYEGTGVLFNGENVTGSFPSIPLGIKLVFVIE